MTRPGRYVLPLTAVALVLSACGTTANPPSATAPTSGTTASSPTPSVATAPWSPQPVSGGLATDQDCTATAALSADMASSGLAPTDLQAMVLSEPSQVMPGWTSTDGPTDGGFMENADVSGLGPDACDASLRTGRITGYLTVWGTDAQVSSSAVAFLTEQGAIDYLSWLPSAVALGEDYYFSIYGSPVTGTQQATLPDVGSDGPAAEVTLTSVGQRMVWVGFRIDNVVGSVSVAAPTASMDAVSGQTIATTAVEQMRAVTPTGAPYDLVTLLSVPVPKAQLGSGFNAYLWDGCCSGLTEEWQLDESLANPMGEARRTAEGWLTGAHAEYFVPAADGQVSTKGAASGLMVYRTAAGAEASRGTTLTIAQAGTDAVKPSKTFSVEVMPDAVGLVTVMRDGSYQDTRVVLPVHGDVVLSATVRGPVGADRRAEAAHIAKVLHERWHTAT